MGNTRSDDSAKRPEESSSEEPVEPDSTTNGASDSTPFTRPPLILDGLPSTASPDLPSPDKIQLIAADPALSILERVEALEEFIDSEIGDTELVRLRHIEREFNLRQLYLKFEGGNPSGTQKDRIAFRQVLDAIRRGYDVVTFASCGNYGVAVAFAASIASIRCVVHLPASSHSLRIREMQAYNAELVFVEGDYEKAVEVSSELAVKNEFYDANPGGANTILQLNAYSEIADEIYDELRDAPAVVAVPVSNGTTLAGIYRGFVRLHRRGKTSKIPRMVGSSSFGKNPIVYSYLKGKSECIDLDASKIKETAVNEPLINWHSFDGDLALEAIRFSKGFARDTSDKKMAHSSRLVRDLDGFHVLPASTAGLCALLDAHRENPFPPDRYVVVITGKRS